MKWCLIAVTLVPLLSLPAETLELAPLQDAYVCCCKPDSTNPNGGSDYLYHGQYGSCFDRTLIQWDLSSVPPGAFIVSATMELFCEAMYGTKTGNPVYYMINESWDELTVTFNTQPGYDTATPLTAAWPEAGTWHQVDVTGFVEEWVGGTHVDFGIYCFCEDTEGTCVPGFWSSDYQEQSLRPRLVVEYFPEGFDQCTWADIKEDQ